MFSLSKFNMKLPGYFKASLIVIGIITLYCFIMFLIMLKVNKNKKTKSKFVLLNISLIKKFNNFVKENIGKHWKFVAPCVLTLAIYIALANTASLIGLKTPTSNTAITVALAIYSICIVQATGIVSRKIKHIKTLFEPFAFMFPINFIGEFTPIISLSLRLFGNIAAGAVIMGLLYGILGWFSPLITPFFHLIFDIAFGFIQAFVFVLLTVLFASNKLEVGDTDPNELIELELEKKAKLELKNKKKIKK